VSLILQLIIFDYMYFAVSCPHFLKSVKCGHNFVFKCEMMLLMSFVRNAR